MEDVNKRRGNFPTLSELGYGIIETLVPRPSQFDQKLNTNSGDKHCEFSHFFKLDVSYAIQHIFSKGDVKNSIPVESKWDGNIAMKIKKMGIQFLSGVFNVVGSLSPS